MAAATALQSISALDQIGEAAGVIWQHLNQNGPTSLTKLVRDLGLHRDVVMQALGWLAREDKLSIDDEGRTRMIRLRD